MQDEPPYPQPSKRSSRITSFVILNLFDEFGVGTKVPSSHQGHFKWEDPHPLIGGVKGDQAVVSRFPKTPIDIPPVARNLNDFKAFAEDHKISLLNIKVDEIIEEMEIRGQMLAGVATANYNIPQWLKRSVTDGYPPQLIALMTLSLFIFGNTELAGLFIFCISKYSDKTIRIVMKSISDKTF